MNHYLYLLACCCFLWACGNADEKPTVTPPTWTKTELDAMNVFVVAGDYYEVQLGIRGDQLTGYYQDPSDRSGKPCSFFFEGTIGTENPIEVLCYQPRLKEAPFKGTLKVLTDAMIIKLDQSPAANCTKEFTDEVGRSVVMDTKRLWSSIRMTQHATHLRNNPDIEAAQISDTPLAKGTAIAISKKQGSWAWVDVIGTTTQGWIDLNTLYPLRNK